MKWKPYPAYKDSGVEWLGDVPTHWVIEPLKYSFQIVGGSTPKSEMSSYWDGEIVWVTPSDLSKIQDLFIDDSQRKITNEGLSSCGTRLVPAGSIILSTRAPIGSLAVAKREMCTNQGCKSLVPYGSADSNFYAYLLSISTAALNVRGKGTTFLELSGDELGFFRVPSPSNEDQVHIAAFLDRETAKLDTLISKQERLIELLQEKRQAIISHAVTKGLDPDVPMKDSGIEWLGEVPAHWVVKKLRFVGDAIIGLTYDPSEVTDEEHGILVLRSSNVQNKQISYEDNVYVNSIIPEKLRTRVGDILICSRNGSRALIGKNALITEQSEGVTFGAFMTVFRSRSNEFLFYVFNSMIFDFQAGSFMTSTVNQLTTGNLYSFEVAMPPQDEQSKIADFLKYETRIIDELIEKTKKSIDLAKEHRSALISAAVTGKIDVREAA